MDGEVACDRNRQGCVVSNGASNTRDSKSIDASGSRGSCNDG